MSQIIAGLYEIERKIGSGGGGIVYLGRHIRLKKQVVLKADRRKLSTDTEALRREVDLLKRLSHTYIPQVYDFVQEDGVVYTVMDYIEGESLDKLLGRGQIPSQPQVIRWARQLLEALCYLHGQPPYGILHGDIKPANIMLRPNGDVCLIDFNIALALGEEGAVNVGYSRGYASPEHYSADYISGDGASVSSLPSALSGERLSGEEQKKLCDASDETVKSEKSADLDETQKRKGREEPDRRQRQNESGNIAGRSIKPSALSDGKSTRKREGILLDVRSDIYSLGATLYHLLSGIRPAQDAKEVKALTADVCSPAVSAILQKAMAPDPINRYQTAEEMLEAFLSLHKTDSRVVRHRRRMMRTAALSLLVLLLGGGSTFVGLKQLEQRQTALALAEYSADALAQGDVAVAVSQALAAIPSGNSILDAPVTAQARKALTDALGVYDLSDGFKPVGTIALPGAPFDLSVSPEGSRLAVVYGYEAAVFNLENLEKIAALPIQESALADCLFIDVDHVIYAGADGVACYDLAAQQVVWTGEAATTLAVSYDGSTVAAVNRDAGYATIYNAVDGSVKTECTFDGQNMALAVNDIFADPKNAIFSLNRDGSLLAVSFYNGGLTIFDLQDHDNSMIMYDASEYNHFNGGFCGKYFAFAARGTNAQFAIIDTQNAFLAGTMESEEVFFLEASEKGIFLGNGNVLEEVAVPAMEELELAYTGSVGITNFAVGGQYTLVATEDNGFSFYDSGAHLVTTEAGNQNADFMEMTGMYAVIGNRTEHTLRILRLEGHEETVLASYDVRYPHEEARVSGDGKTTMLFGEGGTFRIYDRNGQFIMEGKLPEAESIYDQQFRREGEQSYLEVIWYDGSRRCYSAEDGILLSEEKGEAPAKDLYEEFFVGNYRIASGLHDAPEVYDTASGRHVATLEMDGYLTYVTEIGEYYITEYIDAAGERYGFLLNGQFETLAYLPGLCDVVGDKLVFDYGSGNLRQSRLYSLQELIALGEAYVG